MLSIIVPCYNEAAVLPALADRLRRAARAWSETWEVLLVNDGSSDDTWTLIQEMHWQDDRFKGVSLARNFGQQAAIGAGLDHAAGDAVVLLDADLQDPPELIERMLRAWRDGFDVVYGIRADRPEAWWKRWCYAAFYRGLARLTSVNLPQDAGDFCLMDRKVVDALRSCPEQQPFWRGLRAWSGFRQRGLAYRRPPRQAGQSQYSWRKLAQLAMDGCFCLMPNPLRGLTLLGAAALLLALVLGGSGAMGAGGLAWAMLVLGSAQLFATGLLGELLARIYREVRRRPRWIVADAVGLAPRYLIPRQNSARGEVACAGEPLDEPSRIRI